MNASVIHLNFFHFEMKDLLVWYLILMLMEQRTLSHLQIFYSVSQLENESNHAAPVYSFEQDTRIVDILI